MIPRSWGNKNPDCKSTVASHFRTSRKTPPNLIVATVCLFHSSPRDGGVVVPQEGSMILRVRNFSRSVWFFHKMSEMLNHWIFLSKLGWKLVGIGVLSCLYWVIFGLFNSERVFRSSSNIEFLQLGRLWGVGVWVTRPKNKMFFSNMPFAILTLLGSLFIMYAM